MITYINYYHNIRLRFLVTTHNYTSHTLKINKCRPTLPNQIFFNVVVVQFKNGSLTKLGSGFNFRYI